MGERVAIVGAGHAGFAPITAGVSYKELSFEAAMRAYDDAGVEPRKDVDSFVAVSEDFWEGTSIFDEYVPDQIGGALRPVHTVSADGLFAVATAVMLIRSGNAEIVAVEGHSKASDILTLGHIHQFALDPVWNRPLGLPPLALAGLEMNRYLEVSGATEEQCALVVEKNRRNALDNPRAAYPTDMTADDVEASGPVWWPLRGLDVAQRADGCVVLVLASEARARELTDDPVWVAGVGWSSGTPTLESRSWDEADYVRQAANRAYEMARLGSPTRDVDLAEVDDTYSYRELMHLEALRLARPSDAGPMLEEGFFGRDGELPVNASGGSLGQGYLFEANGLARALECVLQLRGEAGERQVEDAGVAVAQSWRGVPTTTAAVAVFASQEAAA
ncbi:MAG TPA: acetyl-CoA acetyltransferase [Actinomycetota bacterium]|nr:acetyl-CoA acetyltransferase [Actinomycetota bacterium]